MPVPPPKKMVPNLVTYHRLQQYPIHTPTPAGTKPAPRTQVSAMDRIISYPTPTPGTTFIDDTGKYSTPHIHTEDSGASGNSSPTSTNNPRRPFPAVPSKMRTSGKRASQKNSSASKKRATMDELSTAAPADVLASPFGTSPFSDGSNKLAPSKKEASRRSPKSSSKSRTSSSKSSSSKKARSSPPPNEKDAKSHEMELTPPVRSRPSSAATTPRQKLLLLSCGGTITQRADLASGSKMVHNAIQAVHLLEQVDISASWTTKSICKKSGPEMKASSVFKLRDVILSEKSVTGIVVILGTDSLAEVAFFLDYLLHTHVTVPVVLTGAFKPSDIPGFDGVANLRNAGLVALSPEAASLGVLVLENNTIHCARYVYKHDSQRVGGFRSTCGPIGFVRSQKCVYNYTALPPLSFVVPVSLSAPSFEELRVVIWMMALNPYLPEIMMADVDGLVVVGQGTGSISTTMVELLQSYTDTIPIAITTSSVQGNNYDDYVYKGSLEKYESLGFAVSAYAGLSPSNARIVLMLRLCLRL
eukprot:TRINITY_DN10807_c0_g1_i1.p1 TRINITY_DN10807_c0_g1~~TRINITY_DN10807_c0_g1_i1.p1  ORF type:complete len:573 (+),score=87.11 TRINITY_DN10807_c0_g1_i1:134-1720(+)